MNELRKQLALLNLENNARKPPQPLKKMRLKNREGGVRGRVFQIVGPLGHESFELL